jgi:hydroxypyruvate isomerase
MRIAANLAFFFRDRPILERFQMASDAGFAGVELWSCENAPPDEVAAAATAAGTEIVCCNAASGDLQSGGVGLSGVPGREREFEAAVRSAAATARAIGCRQVNVGPCRLASEEQRASAMATLARNLAFAGNELGRWGIRALVEPLNPVDMPGVLLAKVADAMDAISRAANPNVCLLFDIYHVTQIEPSPLRCLEQHFGSIAHIQFADVPGRGAPGTGTIPFREFFDTLKRLAYRRWISAEYRPTDLTHSSHRWLQSLID